VFSVAADGTLTNVANVTDDATLALNRPLGVTTAVIGGIPHMFVAGHYDSGVSVFALDGDVPLLGDVLWQHSDGTVTTAGHEFPAVPDTFQIRETGDFDGDGDSDILWRHAEGLTVIWEMQDGAFVTNHNLGAVPTKFTIAETEDFDSDGDADILWRHTEGLTVTWEMEDGALLQTHNFGVVSNGWQIRGTGEFDLL
jgi:hypothetical protein